MQKIGVFVCHCGTNIAGTVDVKAVAEALGKEPGVVFSAEYPYMCSSKMQSRNTVLPVSLFAPALLVCTKQPSAKPLRQPVSTLTWLKSQTFVSSAPGSTRTFR